MPSVIEGFQLPEGAMTLGDPAAAPPTVVLVDDDLLGLDLLDHLISGDAFLQDQAAIAAVRVEYADGVAA